MVNISKFIISMCGHSRVCVFIRNGFSKIFFMEFYHSGVYFCYVNCVTSVLRNSDICCLCPSGRITISFVIFIRGSDSLVNFSVIV